VANPQLEVKIFHMYFEKVVNLDLGRWADIKFCSKMDCTGIDHWL
jgi:hypothetical protein